MVDNRSNVPDSDVGRSRQVLIESGVSSDVSGEALLDCVGNGPAAVARGGLVLAGGILEASEGVVPSARGADVASEDVGADFSRAASGSAGERGSLVNSLN